MEDLDAKADWEQKRFVTLNRFRPLHPKVNRAHTICRCGYDRLWEKLTSQAWGIKPEMNRCLDLQTWWKITAACMHRWQRLVNRRCHKHSRRPPWSPGVCGSFLRERRPNKPHGLLVSRKREAGRLPLCFLAVSLRRGNGFTKPSDVSHGAWGANRGNPSHLYPSSQSQDF